MRAELIPDYNSDQLLTCTETLQYLKERYGIKITLRSFYSMISRGQSPKPTYFRTKPRFYIADIDAWVLANLSDRR